MQIKLTMNTHILSGVRYSYVKVMELKEREERGYMGKMYLVISIMLLDPRPSYYIY